MFCGTCTAGCEMMNETAELDSVSATEVAVTITDVFAGKVAGAV
jgi:hypothetical protein